MFSAIHTPSSMHGKKMVVVAYLCDDLGTGCFPFHCGGLIEVLASIVHSYAYSSVHSMTYSIVPFCGCFGMVVCDPSGAVISS
jgi:hypothetical protein